MIKKEIVKGFPGMDTFNSTLLSVGFRWCVEAGFQAETKLTVSWQTDEV